MSQPQTIAQPVPPAQAAQQQPPKPRNRTWDENYAQLLVYKAQHGHCDVPLNHKNDRVLGKWVAHLRENCNQSSLSTERREALNAIGFNWNPHEQKWMEMFQRLQGFKKSEGHCKVPTNWKPDKKLGKWVMRQREKRKNGILPDARREALESIGFVWKVHKVEQNKETRKTQHVDEKWQERYQSLVKFEKENGHCNVPKVYDKDPQLGKWVQEQRVMYQRNLLKAERKKLLEDIGFIFSYRAQKIQQDWNQMYELLKACSETTDNGQFKVTVTDSSLSRWIQRQKEAYKNYRLDPGREILLNKINFPFPERAPPKLEDPLGAKMATNAAGLPVNPYMATAAGENLFAGSPGMALGAAAAAMTHQQPLLLGHPNSVAAHLQALNNKKRQEAFISGQRQEPRVAPEAEQTVGVKLAEGMALLAKCMGISKTELVARLALTSPDSAKSTKSKLGKRKKPEGDDDEKENDQEDDKSNAAEESPPVQNAFTSLLPKIMAIREDVVSNELESCQRDAAKYLEMYIRREKGWDPRPTDGDGHQRLLALATEMGILLDHKSERCQTIVQSCADNLDYVYSKATKKKADKVKEKENDDSGGKSTSNDTGINNNSAEDDSNAIKADFSVPMGTTAAAAKPGDTTNAKMEPPQTGANNAEPPGAKRQKVGPAGAYVL